MIATGKRARKATGLNRHRVHFVNHTTKSDAKRHRSGWSYKATQDR